MRIAVIIIVSVIALCSVARAQQMDTIPIDTLTRVDTAAATPLVMDSALIDSIHRIYPAVDVDTLTATQRNYVLFETRYRLQRQAQKPVEMRPEFSFYDSLAAELISPRWNLRADIDRSFYRDAGDYFKFDPGYFVLEPQLIPTRKTVQPYGLSGDRLGFVVDDRRVAPFEHAIEPDGLTDLNGIPTALDHLVAVLPGPVGQVFGGRSATAATLLTRPQSPDTSTSVSSLLVDKGAYGYSFARGRYAGRFTNGRQVNASMAYRKADGYYTVNSDDSYDYSADLLLPVGTTSRVRASGWLYDRKGPFVIRPYGRREYLWLDRFDRYGQLSWIRHDSAHTRRLELGYRHTRQSSNIDDGYKARLDNASSGLFAVREWSRGESLLRASLSGDHLEYTDRSVSHTRWSGEAQLTLARLHAEWKLAVDLRDTWVEEFRTLPAVSAVISRDQEKSFFMFSAGYSERAPSLHELHHARQEARLYGTPARDYADEGNPALTSERQLIGSVEWALGPLDDNIDLSLTGGHIIDGIDWVRWQEGSLTVFSPRNGDVDFATATTRLRIGLGDYLHLLGGGSYHYLDYENFEAKAYSPDFQAFSGLELHVFWPQKLMHFWAYGEFVYTSAYDGYELTGLGQEPVFNVKLSFKLGGFRFHWLSQNVLSNPYETREYMGIGGRYNSYGFTWDFLN